MGGLVRTPPASPLTRPLVRFGRNRCGAPSKTCAKVSEGLGRGSCSTTQTTRHEAFQGDSLPGSLNRARRHRSWRIGYVTEARFGATRTTTS